MAAPRTPTRPPSRAKPDAPRFPSGKLREPIGMRPGGPAWAEADTLIAQAALRVFADRGYSALTREVVAREAGVSNNTVKRHYPTKIELAVAAIGELPTEAGWFDGHDSIEERIIRSSHMGAAHREYLVPILASAIVHRQDAPELLRAVRDHVLIPRRDVIAAAVLRAKADKQMRPEVDPDMLLALQLGQLIDSFVGIHPRGTGDDMAAYALEHLWPLLRADPPTTHATPATRTTSRGRERTT